MNKVIFETKNPAKLLQAVLGSEQLNAYSAAKITCGYEHIEKNSFKSCVSYDYHRSSYIKVRENKSEKYKSIYPLMTFNESSEKIKEIEGNINKTAKLYLHLVAKWRSINPELSCPMINFLIIHIVQQGGFSSAGVHFLQKIVQRVTPQNFNVKIDASSKRITHTYDICNTNNQVIIGKIKLKYVLQDNDDYVELQLNSVKIDCDDINKEDDREIKNIKKQLINFCKNNFRPNIFIRFWQKIGSFFKNCLGLKSNYINNNPYVFKVPFLSYEIDNSFSLPENAKIFENKNLQKVLMLLDEYRDNDILKDLLAKKYIDVDVNGAEYEQIKLLKNVLVYLQVYEKFHELNESSEHDDKREEYIQKAEQALDKINKYDNKQHKVEHADSIIVSVPSIVTSDHPLSSKAVAQGVESSKKYDDDEKQRKIKARTCFGCFGR